MKDLSRRRMITFLVGFFLSSIFNGVLAQAQSQQNSKSKSGLNAPSMAKRILEYNLIADGLSASKALKGDPELDQKIVDLTLKANGVNYSRIEDAAVKEAVDTLVSKLTEAELAQLNTIMQDPAFTKYISIAKSSLSRILQKTTKVYYRGYFEASMKQKKR